MTAVRSLESYVCGQWARGAREGATVLDAATGEPVATVDSSGLDFAAALAHARETGGPALRKLSFHQRAAMLKALAQKLTEQKEEFYALSFATGATRSDSAIDIEGGIGTLAFYASRGRRDLPNTSVLVDGGVEGLSKDDSFSAQHILTPLTGAAIHINAFNFPCWGMLEKLAPTLLAGMPAIVKPASQTAYLTELMVRRMIEAGVLPEGALQLICGGVGDLIDHVEGQDVVTFTGSADTGRRLRSHPAIVANSVRFNMEADSLNAAILGADATPGSEEFDLFVKEVVREMTAKAGQKCTAIRRVLVPRAACEAVAKAIGDRLAKIGGRRSPQRGRAHGRARQPGAARGGARPHPRDRRRGRDRRRRSRRRARRRRRRGSAAPSSIRCCSIATSRRTPARRMMSRLSAPSAPSCLMTAPTRRSRWRGAARVRWSPACSPTMRPSRAS